MAEMEQKEKEEATRMLKCKGLSTGVGKTVLVIKE